MPIHWGFMGAAKKGYGANVLTPFVGDANIETPEYKAARRVVIQQTFEKLLAAVQHWPAVRHHRPRQSASAFACR